MTSDRILTHLLTTARRRAALRAAAFASPFIAVAVAAAWRLGGDNWGKASLLAGVVVGGIAAALAVRRIDGQWLARRLDAREVRMEDSAGLLFAGPHTLSPLQRLQRQRLQQRLATAAPPELRPAWRARHLAATVLSASAVIALILLWPASSLRTETAEPRTQTRRVAAAPTHTTVTRQRLDIVPPTYTRLPQRSEDGFETKVLEGATIRWSLRFAPAPGSAALVFHDGSRLPLVRDGDDWRAARRIDKPMLYRIVPTDAPPLKPDRLHRIDVAIDQPPQLKVIAPDNTLTMRGADQRAWSLAFEASDDFGLAPAASLRVTLAQGSGENIRFSERTLLLHGQGGAARKRYGHTFDLAPLGLAAGDDLIVQLSVADNRAGQPQTTRSASYILRLPPEELAEATGIDGVVKKALPAYFRSQRQIIIDSEALLAERRKLAPDTFLSRSDGIGVDQRLLRLRYGQFLGEESEGAPRQLLPIADAETDEEHDAHAGDEAHQEEASSAPLAEDAHDHGEVGTGGSPAAFGKEENVLEAYGHTHDDAEAATLLDPETRKTLKAALDQMWQAELHLRQGRPDLALPYEYKALDYIKQVQQAGRVYLARVGAQLPPIDESRRLGGDRKGLASRTDPLAPATAAPPLLATLWRALESPPGSAQSTPDFDGAERWLRANERRLPDALGVIAALDAVRREPDCAECRQLLRSRLWPLLPRPLAAPAPRMRPDRSGQAYLDALGQEARR